MSNSLDTDAGMERFGNYEAELRLVSADLSQKLDTLPSQSGDARQTTVLACERLLDEAAELITSMKMEKSSIPTAQRSNVASRLRNHETDVDGFKRQLASLTSSRAQLFGSRYKDDPEGGDEHMEQRQQLLSGTERLTRSSQRLTESQRIANETEQIGASTLSDLAQQRETIENTRTRLLESEGYTDRSIKTLRGMARRLVNPSSRLAFPSY